MAEAAKSNLTVEAIAELAHKQLAIEAEIEDLNTKLVDAKRRLTQVCEGDLPEVMDTLGLENFSTREGVKVEVADVIHAGFSKDREPEGVAWLNENGHGGTVKRKIEITFNRGEEEWARKFVRDLRKRKKPVRAEDRQSVHSQTLLALVREMLREGIEFPLELFGVYRSRISKVTTPKGD